MEHCILIVDDEESIRFTFREFLQDAGYRIDTARNFEEAVEACEEQEFDAVFLDILLGRESGIEVLQVIKKLSPNTPVTMVTGAPEVKSAAEAVRHGAFDYLMKPVSQDVLLRQAKRAIDYKRVLDLKDRYRKRMRAVFQGVREGILVFDPFLNLIDINEAGQQMLGCDESVLNKNLGTLVKADDCRILKALKELIETRFEGEIFRVELDGPDNANQVFSITFSPLSTGTGLDADLVVVLRDESSPAQEFKMSS